MSNCGIKSRKQKERERANMRRNIMLSMATPVRTNLNPDRVKVEFENPMYDFGQSDDITRKSSAGYVETTEKY